MTAGLARDEKGFFQPIQMHSNAHAFRTGQNRVPVLFQIFGFSIGTVPPGGVQIADV